MGGVDTLANAYEVRRETGWFAENPRLDDVDSAIAELDAFAAVGGRRSST